MNASPPAEEKKSLQIIAGLDPAYGADSVATYWHAYQNKDGKSVFEQIWREEFLKIAEHQMSRRARGVINLTERKRMNDLIEQVKATPA